MSLAETLNSLEGWFDRAGRTTLLDALRSDIEVLPGFYFLSLADALSVRAENLTSGAWDWLPLLTDGAGYHFAVDLNGECLAASRVMSGPDKTTRKHESEGSPSVCGGA